METKIKEFCVKYNEKLKTDKDIKENKIPAHNDDRIRIDFRLNVYEASPNTFYTCFASGYTGRNLLTLDAEDLEYLYKKYSKKLEDEMEQNIAKVRESYEKVLNTK